MLAREGACTRLARHWLLGVGAAAQWASCSVRPHGHPARAGWGDCLQHAPVPGPGPGQRHVEQQQQPSPLSAAECKKQLGNAFYDGHYHRHEFAGGSPRHQTRTAWHPSHRSSCGVVSHSRHALAHPSRSVLRPVRATPLPAPAQAHRRHGHHGGRHRGARSPQRLRTIVHRQKLLARGLQHTRSP